MSKRKIRRREFSETMKKIPKEYKWYFECQYCKNPAFYLKEELGIIPADALLPNGKRPEKWSPIICLNCGVRVLPRDLKASNVHERKNLFEL